MRIHVLGQHVWKQLGFVIQYWGVFLSQQMDNILDIMGIFSGDPKSHEIALANVEYIMV